MALPIDRPWLERALLARLVPSYADDPVSALLDAADDLGVGPVALFEPNWYRSRYQIPANAPAFLHYLKLGAAQGFDPHPLFSVPYYQRQAPEAAGQALLHFLHVGGHDGRDCHKLFSSAWYLDANPDVRESGMIPLLHYLQWGAGEGRTPNPLFCVRHYLRQTDDPAAKSNPLLHFAQHGETARLSPHPSFRADRVRATFKGAKSDGALGTYLEVVGHQQPARVARLDEASPDPELLAPPLARERRPDGAATIDAVALCARLGLGDPGGVYCLGKLQSLRADPMLQPTSPGLSRMARDQRCRR